MVVPYIEDNEEEVFDPQTCLMIELSDRIEVSIDVYHKMKPSPERNTFRKLISLWIDTYNKRMKLNAFKNNWWL